MSCGLQLRVFTSKSKNDASYKFGFLKSILDNLKYVGDDLTLTFDQLFIRLAEPYWNLILEYNLRQKAITKDNRKSAIERVLLEAKDKYVTDDVRSFDSYPQSIMSDVSHQVKMKCKIYVVGAIFLGKVNLGYSTNEILSKYILKTRRPQINTNEILIEAEAIGRNKIKIIEPNISLDNDHDEIDEEAMMLLDAPVALIKLLKKRRGI